MAPQTFPERTNPKCKNSECKNPNLFSGIYVIIPNVKILNFLGISIPNPKRVLSLGRVATHPAKLGEEGEAFFPSPAKLGASLLPRILQ
jgi:hypothetical protein